ncbi:hypothetical protein CK934_28875 [Chitinophaga sp. MD30]|nr:hypothetical protein CK934_28875 [Chitinophaga sp. MD30]
MKMYDLNPNKASNLQQNDEMGSGFYDVRSGSPGNGVEFRVILVKRSNGREVRFTYTNGIGKAQERWT